MRRAESRKQKTRRLPPRNAGTATGRGTTRGRTDQSGAEAAALSKRWRARPNPVGWGARSARVMDSAAHTLGIRLRCASARQVRLRTATARQVRLRTATARQAGVAAARPLPPRSSDPPASIQVTTALYPNQMADNNQFWSHRRRRGSVRFAVDVVGPAWLN
jgi:hypothetical protein